MYVNRFTLQSAISNTFFGSGGALGRWPARDSIKNRDSYIDFIDFIDFIDSLHSLIVIADRK